MNEAEAQKLISSLETGQAGIEAFLELSADERAKIMTMLEQRASAKELRQILEQREDNGMESEPGAVATG